MNCEVELCIYNRNSVCIVKEMEINALAMCGLCILVHLDHDLIESEKERQLQDIESRWHDDDDAF